MLHTVLRRRANGESVEQIRPDLIIPTGKRKGQHPPARPASTGRLPSTTKRRRTPRPSTKPTPTSPPSRRVPDGPIIAGQPYPPDFRRLLRRPPVDPTTLQVRLHRGLRRNGQTGHVGLDTQQVTPPGPAAGAPRQDRRHPEGPLWISTFAITATPHDPPGRPVSSARPSRTCTRDSSCRSRISSPERSARPTRIMPGYRRLPACLCRSELLALSCERVLCVGGWAAGGCLTQARARSGVRTGGPLPGPHHESAPGGRPPRPGVPGCSPAARVPVTGWCPAGAARRVGGFAVLSQPRPTSPGCRDRGVRV